MTFKDEKKQTLKADLGSKTGQMREAKKPSYTEEEKTPLLFISGTLLPLLVSEIPSFIKKKKKSVKLTSYGTQDSQVGSTGIFINCL